MINTTTAKYPQNLLDEIMRTINNFRQTKWAFPLPEDFDASLNAVLNTLSKREKQIILHRFKENLSLKDIGAAENISAAKTRQIITKAVYKLSRPENVDCLRHGIAKIPKTADNLETTPKNRQLSIPIESLGLSSRSINALRRINCQTLGDIAGLSRHTIERIPCIGEKSRCEIEKTIQNYGLRFADSKK